MTKLLYLTTACLLVGACVGKQPIDQQYYQNTTWARGAENVGYGDNSAVSNQTPYSEAWAEGEVPSSQGIPTGDKWQDPQAVQQMAVPAMPEKKIQCTKNVNDYTCRYGQTVCGTGCRADGSNCYYGYCLASECDNVMGQKWNWVKTEGWGKGIIYGCQHPTYNVTCQPNGVNGIMCRDANNYMCGYQCNKNGTDCGQGKNNCWDKYR